MVCQTAHWSNYNACRMPVLDWYLLRVDCHITPFLIKLHWLPIHFRIVLKILLLTFKILHGTALTYSESLMSLKPQSCYNLRSSSDTLLTKQLAFISKATLGTGRLLEQHQNSGVHCHLKSDSQVFPQSLDMFKSKLKTHTFRLAFLSQPAAQYHGSVSIVRQY